MWVPGVKLRSSGLEAITFTCWTISSILEMSFPLASISVSFAFHFWLCFEHWELSLGPMHLGKCPTAELPPPPCFVMLLWNSVTWTSIVTAYGHPPLALHLLLQRGLQGTEFSFYLCSGFVHSSGLRSHTTQTALPSATCASSLQSHFCPSFLANSTLSATGWRKCSLLKMLIQPFTYPGLPSQVPSCFLLPYFPLKFNMEPPPPLDRVFCSSGHEFAIVATAGFEL